MSNPTQDETLSPNPGTDSEPTTSITEPLPSFDEPDLVDPGLTPGSRSDEPDLDPETKALLEAEEKAARVAARVEFQKQMREFQRQAAVKLTSGRRIQKLIGRLGSMFVPEEQKANVIEAVASEEVEALLEFVGFGPALEYYAAQFGGVELSPAQALAAGGVILLGATGIAVFAARAGVNPLEAQGRMVEGMTGALEEIGGEDG